MSKQGFNRLAKYYDRLEYIVFANLLSRARFALLAELTDLQYILIIGGGSGRLLKKILKEFPNIRIDFLEQSPKMIEIAKSRLSVIELEQVRFVESDIFKFETNNTYDGVFSPFFLDCFSKNQIIEIVERLGLLLKDKAYWYDIDFNLPDFGFARARAKLYLIILYKFFNIMGALKTKQLADSEDIFLNNGFCLFKSKTLSMQLVKTSIYQKL